MRFFKTVNLIAATKHYSQDLVGSDKPAYDIKSSIIIVITDGLQQPHPQDRENHLRNMDLVEAAQYAKTKDVRVYLINVDPAINSEKFAPQRAQMEQITRLTGGDYFIVNETTSLNDIYAKLDQLEKSQLPPGTFATDRSKDKQPHNYGRLSLYPWLIGVGLTLLLIALAVDALIYRRVP